MPVRIPLLQLVVKPLHNSSELLSTVCVEMVWGERECVMHPLLWVCDRVTLFCQIADDVFTVRSSHLVSVRACPVMCCDMLHWFGMSCLPPCVCVCACVRVCVCVCVCE